MSCLVHADGAAAPAVTGSVEDARECPESEYLKLPLYLMEILRPKLHTSRLVGKSKLGLLHISPSIHL